MRCPKCNSEAPADFKFCPGCGAELSCASVVAHEFEPVVLVEETPRFIPRSNPRNGKLALILSIVGAALTALLPVYKPLIKKINTSVEVAANEEMGAIDISSEDA